MGLGPGAPNAEGNDAAVVIEAAEQVLKKADKLSRQYNKIPEYDGSRKVSSAPSKARPGVLSPSKAAQIAKPGSPLKAAVVNEEDNIPLAKRRKFLFQNLVSTAEETDAKPKQKCSFELPTNIGAAETLFTKTSNQPPNEPEIIDSNQPPNEPEIIDLLHDSEPEDVKEEDVEQEVARKPTQLDASQIEELECDPPLTTANERIQEESGTHHPAMPRTKTNSGGVASASAPFVSGCRSRPAGPSGLLDRLKRPGSGWMGCTVFDTQYEFRSSAASREFNKSFIKKSRAPPGMGASAIQKRAKELLHGMTSQSPAAAKKTQNAWHNAALAWRQKNKPSEEDVKRRQKEDFVRMTETKKSLKTPAQRAQADGRESGSGASGGIFSGGSGMPAGLVPPSEGAPEIEWRGFYRAYNQAKVQGAASFVQVLRTFKVPVADPARVKEAYRVAVRMYHPDSNSKDRVWSTSTEKTAAEEVMKIINEKKPDDL